MITNTQQPDSLSEILDATRRDERRTALRAVLRRQLWVAGVDADDMLVLLRRHQSWLRDWLQRYTGWPLIVRNDSVRLVKQSVDHGDPTRGASDPGSQQLPLSRSRYVLLCLMLAALQNEGHQTTLRRCAEQTLRLAENDERLTERGFLFDLKSIDTRRSIVCVIRLMLSLGVIQRIEGDEQSFVHGNTDCLYHIQTAVLADLLCLRLGPSTIRTEFLTERLDALASGSGSEFDDEYLRNRQIEHRLIRRLLDDPVMYYSDLTERELVYWTSQRARITRVIEDATGLIPEVRAEGVAMLDADGDLTDVKMPEAGTLGHATLLVGEYFSQRLRNVAHAASVQSDAAHAASVQSDAAHAASVQSDAAHAASVHEFPPDSIQEVAESQAGSPRYVVPLVISMDELAAWFVALARDHQSHWKKGVEEAANSRVLLLDVLRRLEQLRLIRKRPGGIEPLPAVARYAADRVKQSGAAGASK